MASSSEPGDAPLTVETDTVRLALMAHVEAQKQEIAQLRSWMAKEQAWSVDLQKTIQHRDKHLESAYGRIEHLTSLLRIYQTTSSTPEPKAG